LAKLSARCSALASRTSSILQSWKTSCGRSASRCPGLGSLPSTSDVVSPLDARSVVLAHWSGTSWANPSRSWRLRRYRTSTPAADAEEYPASAVDRAVVFCIFDCHMIGDSWYNTKFPGLDLRFPSQGQRLPREGPCWLPCGDCTRSAGFQAFLWYTPSDGEAQPIGLTC
jgi:hypothetical protein